MATPATFTSNGRRVVITGRAGVAKSPLGKFDPATGLTWRHPRLTLNRLRGRSVTSTNPRALDDGSSNTMTASIGMGGMGQRGRTKDVGASKARGESTS